MRRDGLGPGRVRATKGALTALGSRAASIRGTAECDGLADGQHRHAPVLLLGASRAMAVSIRPGSVPPVDHLAMPVEVIFVGMLLGALRDPQRPARHLVVGLAVVVLELQGIADHEGEIRSE